MYRKLPACAVSGPDHHISEGLQVDGNRHREPEIQLASYQRSKNSSDTQKSGQTD
jgi:hypothetical protein